MARVLLAANTSWNLRNFRSGLIRELVRRGYKVTTVSPDHVPMEVDGVEIEHRSVRMDRSGANPLKDFISIYDFATIIRDQRPDIMLGFTIKPNIYATGLCRLFNIPAIPNVSGLGTAFLGASHFRRPVLLMYRFAFGGENVVFFQNPDDQELFLRENIVRPGQSRVLPGSGVDLADFSPSELPSEIRFLMIARLLGDKGVREYVGAARKLRSRFPEASFSLLGELDRHNRTAITEQELHHWIDEGVIDYLGSASDVRPFIRAASAIVLPSYREGLPRTLLEGAAMGRPLVGTDVPGCRRLVREGLTGFLCEAQNVDSLAAAMEKLARAPHEQRRRMGANARTMAEEEFDEALVVAVYLEAIEQLLSLKLPK